MLIACTVITGALDSPERKASICTLLAWALACRAMLRPAQTRLYKWVLLPAVNEQILAFSRTIDSHPDLGLLVETLPLQYLPSLSFYPLPAHIAGRLSNIRMAKFAGLARQHPAGCSFIRLFAAPC